MQFRQITASKYIGDNGYSLIRCKDDSFCICKDNVPTQWGSYFVSVTAAQSFLNSHDYIHASIDTIGMNADDAIAIMEMYEAALPAGYSLKVNDTDDKIYIELYKNNRLIEKYIDGIACINRLESLIPQDIFSCVVYRGVEYRQIFAARDNRSTRNITRDLVRVKSSNVWAYGIEIKDRKAAKGDVYVQFKGKNGGPADVYRYYDVPITVWRRILSYPSKGSAIWKFLRNNFLYSKLTGSKKGVLPNAVN